MQPVSLNDQGYGVAERWWADRRDERYWLEATDRGDIGSDLRAPLADAAGRENWRYTLFREPQPEDVVFHYNGQRANGIVGWSLIAGAPEPNSIVWKAPGSYAREHGAVAEEQPGYCVPLEGYMPLSVNVAGRRDAAVATSAEAQVSAGAKLGRD